MSLLIVLFVFLLTRHSVINNVYAATDADANAEDEDEDEGTGNKMLDTLLELPPPVIYKSYDEQ